MGSSWQTWTHLLFPLCAPVPSVVPDLALPWAWRTPLTELRSESVEAMVFFTRRPLPDKATLMGARSRVWSRSQAPRARCSSGSGPRSSVRLRFGSPELGAAGPRAPGAQCGWRLGFGLPELSAAGLRLPELGAARVWAPGAASPLHLQGRRLTKQALRNLGALLLSWTLLPASSEILLLRERDEPFFSWSASMEQKKEGP